jgi:hypothetical protein
VTPPSEKDRALATIWRDALGDSGGVSVHAYHNEDESLRVDIFCAVDAPQVGVSTYATLGVSNYGNKLADDTEAGTELIAVAASGSDLPARTLATLSFDHFRPGITLRPGLIIPKAISRNNAHASLPHALLTDPFLWDDLQQVEIRGMFIFPLLAVPVSETEFRFAEKHGADALEALFERVQIDVFDWDRPAAT